jgi:hypothetical protein
MIRRQIGLYIILAIIILLILLIIINKAPCFNEPTYDLPKYIWMYWDNENPPKLIQQIRDYTINRCKEWTVYFLNEKTVFNYIPAHKFPKKYKDLGSAHKADWIRLYLLKTYGGCWLDASIIINQVDELNKLHSDSIKIKSQFTGFCMYKDDHPRTAKNGIPYYIENWFIMGPRNGKVIDLWLKEYETAIDMGFLEYKKKLVSEKVYVNAITTPHDDGIYLTEHICIQKVFQKLLDPLPPTIFIDCIQTMFKLLAIDCGSKPDCLMNTLKNDKDVKNKYPYIKLRSEDRATNIDITEFFERN